MAFPSSASYPVPLDADAKSYFTRAGVTNQAARDQINRFIIALKAASLWSGADEIWLLRQAQNDPTLTTAYGLKNAGRDGTPANTPAWGANEFVFNGTNQSVQMGGDTYSLAAARTTICVAQATNAVGFALAVAIAVPVTGGANRHLTVISQTKMSLQGNSSDYDPAFTLASGVRFMSAFAQTGSLMRASKDGAAFTSTAGTVAASVNNRITVGQSGFGATYMAGGVSLVALYPSSLSDANIAAFYSAYKNSAGTGLSLP